ncbi:hypothetical protein GGX14DRAFT_698292 [Mycena pura]|uniref:Uncharacterized protein n=1 Tax=Mycena pura TaxID=153505 RepID=A0AAD6Y8G7_9AGAR|nr:hypothetical protein GGX14DRAFT_698292 [Mycena pura]
MSLRSRLIFRQTHPIICRILPRAARTISQTTATTTMVQADSASRTLSKTTATAFFDEDTDPNSRRNICANFYRTKIDIAPFSCDWDKWSEYGVFLLGPGWHDLTEFDFYVKRLLNIPGTPHPLAFLPYGPDPCVVFEASGEYYFLNLCKDYLERFGGDFASDDDFLARLPHATGKRKWLPKNTEKKKLYDRVCREQQRLAEAAEKSKQGHLSLPHKPSNYWADGGGYSAVSY